jgi:hypothetical protein
VARRRRLLVFSELGRLAGSARDLGAVAMIDPEVVRRLVEQLCAAQGVPVKVTDAVAIRNVVCLLGGPRGRRAPQAKRGRGGRTDALQAPDRVDPLWVQAAGTEAARADLDAVDNSGDDGRLTAQVQ